MKNHRPLLTDTKRGLRVDAPTEEPTQSHNKKRGDKRDSRRPSLGGGSSKRPRTSSATPTTGAKPLQGILVAVTSAKTTTQSTSCQELNYKSILQLCETAGANVTSQVHAKVRCVVATTSAIDSASQRVRKAWRKNIPVVSVEWLQACIQAGNMVDMAEYRMYPRDEAIDDDNIVSQEDMKSKLLEALGASKDDDRKVPSELVLDLGCCCSCHDTGALDCPWCTDCANNRTT